MAELKKITPEEFKDIIYNKKFNEKLLTKDYYVTIALYFIRSVPSIYFKGGTALQKTILNHVRLSEDIDFTTTENTKKVSKEIIKILSETKYFDSFNIDKDVDGFTRIVAHYRDFKGGEDTLFIDLNRRAKIITKPKTQNITHFYKGFIPEFSIQCLSEQEMVAEKMAATIGRNKPRDHYDLYQIIKRKIPINLHLVEQKCKQSGDEFSIIKMFNQAQKLHNRWKEDLEPLLTEEITFKEIMSTLAKHFGLKNEKEKLKKK